MCRFNFLHSLVTESRLEAGDMVLIHGTARRFSVRSAILRDGSGARTIVTSRVMRLERAKSLGDTHTITSAPFIDGLRWYGASTM